MSTRRAEVAVGDTVEVLGRRGKVTALAPHAPDGPRVYVQYSEALWGRERADAVRLVRRARRKR